MHTLCINVCVGYRYVCVYRQIVDRHSYICHSYCTWSKKKKQYLIDTCRYVIMRCLLCGCHIDKIYTYTYNTSINIQKDIR